MLDVGTLRAMVDVGTGYAPIDAALGGLITGDNVVWICDDADLYRQLAAGFVASADPGDGRALVVDFGSGLLGDLPDVDRIDASAGAELGRAAPLADELERRAHREAPACLVVDHLPPLARRWGPEAVFAFFARVCPTMLEAGVTAYWRIDGGLGRTFVEHVRQITQCLLDVRGGRLRVLKAEGRPDELQGIAYQLRIAGDRIDVASAPAGGRLARGLTAVRRELGLTQQELAQVAGVTPSAISQAESGVRGLSLDTVILMSERLGVTVDRLLAAGPPRRYRLARHDRSRRLPDGHTAAMLADSTLGVRAYLADLGPGASGRPPFEHRGAALVLVQRGLVQVDLADDRPVLRAGDVLMVDDGEVRAWRNLRAEPARLHWIVRD